jgi:hypothetical protein
LRIWIAGALAIACAGCLGVGAESNFTSGLSIDRCDGTFPICQTTAGCTMGVGRYLEGTFPGSRQFIVPAPEEAFINVRIFFKTESATGIDTEIQWNEPGCFETYDYQSDGADIFQEAGNSQIFEKSKQVFQDGDHLVSVASDAVADYALVVEVMSAAGTMK